MSRTTFSEEQQQQLRSIKYTAKVTGSTLSFTKEFKQLFYEKQQAGILPRDILRECGYPVESLGKQRIWGIAYSIKKEYEANGCFQDGRATKAAVSKTETTTQEQQIQQLQQKVDYLTQEVEFLKKISSIRTTRK